MCVIVVSKIIQYAIRLFYVVEKGIGGGGETDRQKDSKTDSQKENNIDRHKVTQKLSQCYCSVCNCRVSMFQHASVQFLVVKKKKQRVKDIQTDKKPERKTKMQTKRQTKTGA